MLPVLYHVSATTSSSAIDSARSMHDIDKSNCWQKKQHNPRFINNSALFTPICKILLEFLLIVNTIKNNWHKCHLWRDMSKSLKVFEKSTNITLACIYTWTFYPCANSSSRRWWLSQRNMACAIIYAIWW